MPIVASFTVPGLGSIVSPCGDADRNGRNELYVYGHSGPDFFLRAYEHTGGNVYSETTFWGRLRPLCAGDADRDGRFDVVVSSYIGNWLWLMLFESPDSAALPRDTSAVARGIFYNASVTDLDLDSLPEITVLTDGGWLRLYECTGNNRFTEIAQWGSPSNEGFAGFCAGDADQDGRPELLVSVWGTPQFYVYEASGNNEIQLVAVCTTDVRESRELAIADDMDQDGRKEVIVVSGGSLAAADIMVYETTSDNRFERVWSQRVQGGVWIERYACSGDIDGDGVPEFAVADGESLRVYMCTGNDQYEQVWSSREPDTRVTAHDVNGNGRVELIHCHGQALVLREYQTGGLSEQTRRRLEQVVVRPTVVGRGGMVRIAGMGNAPYCHPELGEGSRSRRTADSSASPQNDRNRMADGGVRVEVLDATGRCDKGCDKVAFSGGVAVWDTRGVVPGAYFIRVSSGSQSITHKVLILPR